MTIDERIDRLTDRHEALAESVQLLVAQGRESSERLDRLGERVDQVSENLQKLSTTVDKLSANVDVLQQSMLSLVGFMRSHETRILKLEGQA